MADHQGLMTRLTVDERAEATEARSEIMAELAGFPVWVETRADLMSVELKKVLCRYLNALIESVFELQNVLTDPVLACLTSKCAEACLRCKFQRSPNSGAVASLTPRSSTSSSAWHDGRAQAYGFGPPYDPNLALTDPLRDPPLTVPPSTHLSGSSMGIYATAATAGAEEEGSDGWAMDASPFGSRIDFRSSLVWLGFPVGSPVESLVVWPAATLGS